MALNDTALNVGMDAIADAFPYLSLHTTGEVTSSDNESTAGRVAANWAEADNGDIVATGVEFTGGASGGPVVRVGYWSASTGGTYGGGSLLTGDATFNAAGEYTVTSVTEAATAS